MNAYGFYSLHCAFTGNICYQTLYLVLPRQLKFLSLQERRLQDAGILWILVRRRTQEYTFECEHMPEMKKSTCLRKCPHRWERNKQANYSPSSGHSDKKKAVLKSHGYKEQLHWAGNRTIFTTNWGKAGSEPLQTRRKQDFLCREKSQK